jgi:Flp pilus assembly protein TadD
MSSLSSGAVEALYATAHWLLGSSRFADAARVFRVMAYHCPEDERGWLGLGLCHEKIGQLAVAAEMYRIGDSTCPQAVRCGVALARALRLLGRDDDASTALERASDLAAETGDETLIAIVAAEGGA